MKLYDTNLPDAFSTALFNEQHFDLAPDHIDKMYDAIFTGTAQAIAGAKSMQHPTAFIFERYDNTFVAACVVQFFENEDPENPGNWNMIWTFNKEDIPEGSNVISINNPMSHPYFRGVIGEKYGMRFEGESELTVTLVYCLEQLKKWLDDNAKDNEEVSVEFPGLFQARVAVEGGEKVFALEADGEIKNIIKDDAAIEKR